MDRSCPEISCRGRYRPRDHRCRRRRVILVKREITMTKPEIVHRPSRAKQRAPLKHRVAAACGGACGAATTRLIAGNVRTESALWAETHTHMGRTRAHQPTQYEEFARESMVYPEAIRSGALAIRRDDSATWIRANSLFAGAGANNPRENAEIRDSRRDDFPFGKNAEKA